MEQPRYDRFCIACTRLQTSSESCICGHVSKDAIAVSFGNRSMRSSDSFKKIMTNSKTTKTKKPLFQEQKLSLQTYSETIFTTEHKTQKIKLKIYNTRKRKETPRNILNNKNTKKTIIKTVDENNNKNRSDLLVAESKTVIKNSYNLVDENNNGERTVVNNTLNFNNNNGNDKFVGETSNKIDENCCTNLKKKSFELKEEKKLKHQKELFVINKKICKMNSFWNFIS